MPETRPCYGRCGARVLKVPGIYYCDACVTRQREEYARERQAFDDYHAWADAVARAGRRSPMEPR